MKSFLQVSIITIYAFFVLAGCTGGSVSNLPLAHADARASSPKKTMHSFHSEQELTAYLKELAEKQKRLQRRAEAMSLSSAQPSAAPMESKSADANKDKGEDSVTNVQHAGVDEGGIVKVHGNHLVVLRRGRLFTVAIGDGALNPISSVDAFGPDIDPNGTWYDEMLVSDDTIAVIGYSYQRGGTEVGLFQIDPAGKLSYRSTYHLRSNDYYSSRNYASRLVGRPVRKLSGSPQMA